MAKKSMVERLRRNEKMVARGVKSGAREKLKSVLKAPLSVVDASDKMDAMLALQQRPRNESSVRIKTRCQQCGRVRGYVRRFGLCRLCVRKFFGLGVIPGLVKSSW